MRYHSNPKVGDRFVCGCNNLKGKILSVSPDTIWVSSEASGREIYVEQDDRCSEWYYEGQGCMFDDIEPSPDMHK